MRFQYGFQKILDIKQKEKEQLQLSLSSSIKGLEIEKNSYHELLQQRETIENQLISKQEESVNIYQLVEIHIYQQSLEKTIIQSSQRLQKAEKEVDRKTQQVAEKAKEEKSWQLLKNKEWSRFKYEEGRKEQNRLDEIATSLFLRSNHS